MNMKESYHGIEWFDKPYLDRQITMREMLAMVGPRTDFERFIHSGQGEAYIKSNWLRLHYSDGMHPDVIKYWDDRGVKKEVHYMERDLASWYSYVPKKALEPGTTKKYPLIINIGHEPFDSEPRGYPELAATEDVIVIMPPNRHMEDVYALYYRAMDMFPIDVSRVYMSGFSFAGFRTLAFAMHHPEPLAGIAVNCHLWPYIWRMPDLRFRELLTQKMMPIICYVGNKDVGQPVPINVGNDNSDTMYGDAHVHSAQDNLDAANMWLGINHCAQIPLDKALESANSANKWEREIGLPVSRGDIKNFDDTEYYFGDFVSDDGVYRTRIISIDNTPHCEFGSMASVAWDFLKCFSRSPDDGLSVFKSSL